MSSFPTPSVESWEEIAALTAVNAWSAEHYSAFSTIIYQGIKEAVASTERRVREETLVECINAIPLRSDWDDDERVTFRMATDAMREALEDRLASLRQPSAETQPTDQ